MPCSFIILLSLAIKVHHYSDIQYAHSHAHSCIFFINLNQHWGAEPVFLYCWRVSVIGLSGKQDRRAFTCTIANSHWKRMTNPFPHNSKHLTPFQGSRLMCLWGCLRGGTLQNMGKMRSNWTTSHQPAPCHGRLS